MQYFGSLFLRITSGNGAYPLENAIAYIEGVSANIETLKTGLYSNADGVTPHLKIATPAPEESTTPSTQKSGFSELKILVSAEGYYRKTIQGVSIYPNVTTELPVNMMPFSRNDVSNNVPSDYNVDIE